MAGAEAEAEAEAEAQAETRAGDRSDADGAMVRSQPVSLCVPLVRGERTVGTVRLRVSARALDRQKQHEAVFQAGTALVQWRRHAEGLAELARVKAQAGSMQRGSEHGAGAGVVATAQGRREQWQAALECVAATGAAAVLWQVHEGMRYERERQREHKAGTQEQEEQEEQRNDER